jgi:glycerol uptake facilitator-like aquaporin
MHTATIKHDYYFGIAIGFMTTACALSVGDLGSGILNPVTSVALAVVKNRNVGDLWVYLIGDISGTLAACVMWYVWWPSPEKVDHNIPTIQYTTQSFDD